MVVASDQNVVGAAVVCGFGLVMCVMMGGNDDGVPVATVTTLEAELLGPDELEAKLSELVATDCVDVWDDELGCVATVDNGALIVPEVAVLGVVSMGPLGAVVENDGGSEDILEGVGVDASTSLTMVTCPQVVVTHI